MVCIVAFVCCNNQAQLAVEDNVIYLPLKKIEKSEPLDLNRSAFRIDTVSLESSIPESMIGLIKDIRIADSIIFVQNDSRISLFSCDGSFLRTVGHSGRGPGEYLNLYRFDICPEKDLIYVMDDMSRIIVAYDYNGEIINIIKFEGVPRDFAVLPNGEILFYYPRFGNGSFARGLWRADSEGVLKEHLVGINPDFKHFINIEHYLVHINPETVGFMGLEDEDKFYHITIDTAYLSYKMITDYSIPNNIFEDERISDQPLTEYLKSGYLESDSLLIFNLSDLKSVSVRSLLRKTDNALFRVYRSRKANVVSDLFPTFDYCYNGFMIDVIVNSVLSLNNRKDFENPKLLIMSAN